MNLETLGVQEMNAKELFSVDGGGFWDDMFEGTVHGTFGANPIGYFLEAGYNAAVIMGNGWEYNYNLVFG